VVLMVWDVKKREGFWETVPKIVEALDKKGKEWRETEGTVVVDVPLKNGTDDEGTRRLRIEIGNYIEPLVPKQGQFEFTFSFPSTSDGIAAQQAFIRMLDEGGSTVIDRAFIANWSVPPWHDRLYGRSGPPERVELKRVIPSDLVFTMRLEVESSEGVVAIPHLELRPSETGKYGRRHVTMTNEHQRLPMVVTVDFDLEQKKTDVSIRRVRPGRTPYEERDLINVFMECHREGRTLRLIEVERGFILRSAVTAPSNFDGERLQRYRELLDKLCFIQHRAERFGVMRIEREISSDEAQEIQSLFPVFRDGRVNRTIRFDALIAPDKCMDVDGPGTDGKLTLDCGKPSITLLGVKIEVGRVVMVVKDSSRFLDHYRDTLRAARADGVPKRLHIESLDVVQEYLEWLPQTERHVRLSEIASTQAGYFTLKQAYANGYGSKDVLIAEEHVHACGADLFRLLQFPADDHEDLIILWLLTNKAAVISHDTALALHQLSDILPTRRHITVPPGWTASEDAPLPSDVVVHEGNVDPTEITWMGPIPYTKTLRTLRDCTQKSLSPDLLDQAIDEASERGLISAAEAHGLRLARAKSA